MPPPDAVTSPPSAHPLLAADVEPLVAFVSGAFPSHVEVLADAAQHENRLDQLTADATGRDVLAGPDEATALGNVAMQMLATGSVDALAEARAIINHSFPARRFVPADVDRWDRHYRAFRDRFDVGASPADPGSTSALE